VLKREVGLQRGCREVSGMEQIHFFGCIGDVPLRTRFSCLFELTTNKSSTVGEMFALGWEERGAAWRWRRRLWV
jgi:hypothetical protein